MISWTRSGRTGRPSSIRFTRRPGTWDFCFRRRGAQRAQRVFQQHRSDRSAAAGPLRGGVRAKSGCRQRDLATGEWIMRCEARTLDDLSALGGNDAEDERRFATAARVSEINLALYRAFLQPFVRSFRAVNGGIDATDASVAPAVRGVLRCKSVHGMGEWRGRAGARKPQGLRKTIRFFGPRRACPNRLCPPSMPGEIWRSGVRGDIPVDLWIARLAGRCGDRSRDQYLETARRQEHAAPPIGPGADRRTEVANPRGRHSRSGHPGPALRGDDTRRRRRARLRNHPPYSPRTRRPAALPLAEFKALVREQFFMLLIDPAAAVTAIPACFRPSGSAHQSS